MRKYELKDAIKKILEEADGKKGKILGGQTFEVQVLDVDAALKKIYEKVDEYGKPKKGITIGKDEGKYYVNYYQDEGNFGFSVGTADVDEILKNVKRDVTFLNKQEAKKVYVGGSHRVYCDGYGKHFKEYDDGRPHTNSECWCKKEGG